MKKTKILLIILPIIIVAIIIAVIIPVIVSAKKDEFEVPIINEQTIEEANQKERERLLAEKKKFEEDQKNNPSQNESNTSSEQQPLERDEGIDASLAQTKELVDKTDSIISTFRADEYKKVVSKLEIEEQNPDIIEVYSQLSEGRKEFYELILDILENENLNNEDKNILKDYLSNNLLDIKLDADLGTKTEKILNN